MSHLGLRETYPANTEVAENDVTTAVVAYFLFGNGVVETELHVAFHAGLVFGNLEEDDVALIATGVQNTEVDGLVVTEDGAALHLAVPVGIILRRSALQHVVAHHIKVHEIFTGIPSLGNHSVTIGKVECAWHFKAEAFAQALTHGSIIAVAVEPAARGQHPVVLGVQFLTLIGISIPVFEVVHHAGRVVLEEGIDALVNHVEICSHCIDVIGIVACLTGECAVDLLQFALEVIYAVIQPALGENALHVILLGLQQTVVEHLVYLVDRNVGDAGTGSQAVDIHHEEVTLVQVDSVAHHGPLAGECGVVSYDAGVGGIGTFLVHVETNIVGASGSVGGVAGCCSENVIRVDIETGTAEFIGCPDACQYATSSIAHGFGCSLLVGAYAVHESPCVGSRFSRCLVRTIGPTGKLIGEVTIGHHIVSGGLVLGIRCVDVFVAVVSRRRHHSHDCQELEK